MRPDKHRYIGVLCRMAVAGVLAVTAVVAAAATPAGNSDADPRFSDSRALVQEFAGRLQAALRSAMAAGGPTAAIAACKDIAPQIASELSRRSGARVGRTSLRVRNPSNAPAPWQREVLRQFERRAAAGAAEGTALEHTQTGPGGEFRYMRAITTAALCTACHGKTLADDVAAVLEEHYPHDRARGYAPGDIRGAFTIVWPPPAASQ